MGFGDLQFGRTVFSVLAWGWYNIDFCWLVGFWVWCGCGFGGLGAGFFALAWGGF